MATWHYNGTGFTESNILSTYVELTQSNETLPWGQPTLYAVRGVGEDAIFYTYLLKPNFYLPPSTPTVVIDPHVPDQPTPISNTPEPTYGLVVALVLALLWRLQ